MDDFLTKPIKKKQLLGAIERWVDPRPVILVVDDSPDNLKVVEKFLNSTALYKPIFANNGHEAVKKIHQRTISLVLLDMEMPVMDGYRAATEIRKSRYGKTLPIIALTAHHGSKEVKKCLSAGCSSYLSKPIRKKELLASIAEFIEMRSGVTHFEPAGVGS